MEQTILTGGAPHPDCHIGAQILCFDGVDTEGALAGLRLRVPVCRGYPGRERLRLRITDRCTKPSDWQVTEGGCVYSPAGETVDKSLPNFFYGYGNLLLDTTVFLTVETTGEWLADIGVELSAATVLVRDLKRWQGPLYVTLLREEDSAYGLTHSPTGTPAELELQWERPTYDERSFLCGLLTGLL